jgi:hypothetical protein
MFPRVIIALAFLIAAGCARATLYTQWPYRGPMMLVRNPTPHALVVLARDGTGRELVTARVQPKGKQCFRWPFIDATGYLRAAESSSDTLTTEEFQPWSAEGWEWTPEARLTRLKPRLGVCG